MGRTEAVKFSLSLRQHGQIQGHPIDRCFMQWISAAMKAGAAHFSYRSWQVEQGGRGHFLQSSTLIRRAGRGSNDKGSTSRTAAAEAVNTL